MKSIKSIIIYCTALFIQHIHGYDLPSVNLGSSNILDGGPIRPVPGWYFFQYATFYHAERWTGPKGENLLCGDTPKFNAMGISEQFVYQWATKPIFNAHLGVSLDTSLLLYSHVEHNTLNIKAGNIGFGDTNAGIYLQWDTIMKGDRPIFVHRVQLTVGLPTGDYNPKPGIINPGKNIFFIDPYWAATLYITPTFTASWRLFYLWCAKNKTTNVQAGNAIHLNYSLAYEMLPGFNVGINGYFLRQLKNSTRCGTQIPNSKEQTFGIGPGALYFLPKGMVIVGHLYYESAVKNRTEGINLNFSFIKHF